MPGYIDAYGLSCCGWAVQLLLFGWFGFMPKKITLTDFPRIIAAAFFGVALT
jgi:hypothetical protein